ncbi:type VII secretion target [Saccharopolyspora sp. NFXS83]|uniref:type VII secretion target n=1 Tax=Saccharopolyspora sp. NFXS83 TaxID=2993560 RepID=UPI00224B903B|nr:type VII secretion target [Saccharopolyspora sp. NFXS83]MCX2729926.1 type VII secretion target [Saccharopolyspora sp. NFXS83]
MSGHGEVEVTLTALINASTGLDQVIEDVSTVGAEDISDLGADGDHGHEQLATAVSEFADAWGYGLGDLMRDATGLSESLHDSAETYAETENVNIDRFVQGR